MRMDGSIDDVAQSASGIDRQQVALGRWAKESLPADARIGLNDTGAIAYFGERRTFDVVGLTTRSEGRYWVAGTGSRLEHYERLQRTSPSELPTHFIVYPEWFGIDALLGAELEEATVTDSTILGGQTMRAHVADYTLLGSGEAPWTSRRPDERADLGCAVDVADLESEAEHGYELLGARDNGGGRGLRRRAGRPPRARRRARDAVAGTIRRAPSSRRANARRRATRGVGPDARARARGRERGRAVRGGAGGVDGGRVPHPRRERPRGDADRARRRGGRARRLPLLVRPAFGPAFAATTVGTPPP